MLRVVVVGAAVFCGVALALPPNQKLKNVANEGTEDWVTVEVGGASYNLGFKMLNFEDAKNSCAAVAKRLIVMDTKVKAQLWIDFLEKSNTSYSGNWFWIDGRRGPGEAEYVWQATGMPFDDAETLWGIGQPNSSNTYGQCVNFAGFAPSGGWEDENCAIYALSYICEDIPAVTTTTTTTKEPIHTLHPQKKTK